ncbi:MAG: hypothetical protein KBG20_01980 [Caldilineaceae bacterium]|nr:hypothetical protein [Caldilineaceae bacterium]MBP8108064.1 hypothetical protein [Caldilineaceae bacterium]MBP8124602.1 hypothetical protein [Caldilineaceae bacterium]MBP9071032.1 hypothetical protein [Caldilineaceae bacterium]
MSDSQPTQPQSTPKITYTSGRQNSGANTLSGADYVRIRGRLDGLVVQIDPAADWAEVLIRMDAYLRRSADFFQGGQVALSVGPRELTVEQIGRASQILTRYGIRLWAVETHNEWTAQAATAFGVSATLVDQAPDQAAVMAAIAEEEAAETVLVNYDDQLPLLHRGSLRSGQDLRHLGPILLIGDVNPGASVISGADVYIWGRLRGVAHAGAMGNDWSVICALDLEPTQLRIGRQIAVSPNKLGVVRRWFGRSNERKPEIARVIDGQIVVEPWDERGARMALTTNR